ncbi:hypothetical protein LIS82_22305 [Cytobacillus solani]|nr:hypothetical protein [Cytobacillus solani]USK54259.1 hypothetical protein LIS82_22305 [Cytobacillus solani]
METYHSNMTRRWALILPLDENCEVKWQNQEKVVSCTSLTVVQSQPYSQT